jgi:hypothetical protein
MTKEEIIQFLRDNLTISVTTEPHDDFYRGVTGYDIKVKVSLAEEVISESYDSIDIK